MIEIKDEFGNIITPNRISEAPVTIQKIGVSAPTPVVSQQRPTEIRDEFGNIITPTRMKELPPSIKPLEAIKPSVPTGVIRSLTRKEKVISTLKDIGQGIKEFPKWLGEQVIGGEEYKKRGIAQEKQKAQDIAILKKPIVSLTPEERKQREGAERRRLVGLGMGMIGGVGIIKKVSAIKSLAPKIAKLTNPEEIKGLIQKVPGLINDIGTKIDDVVKKLVEIKKPQQVIKTLENFVPKGQVISQVTKNIAPEIGETIPTTFKSNINVGKFNLPQDTKNFIEETAIRAENFVKQRRGVQGWEQTQQLANELAPKIKLKPGTTLNAEELQALGDTTAYLSNKAKQLADIASKTPTEENLLKAQMVNLEFLTSMQSYSGVTAEAGRSLQILRKAREAIDKKDIKLVREILKQIKDPEEQEKILAGLSKIAPDDILGQFRFLQNINKPKVGDYVTELWYNSILSGPFTHLRNLIGNTANLIFETTAGVWKPFVGRGKEYAAENLGTVIGLKEGLKKAVFALKNGFSYDDVAKLELRKPEVFKGIPGAIINIPKRLLIVSDAIVRTAFTQRELYGQAANKALKEGLKGKAFSERVAELITNPSLDMLEAAQKYGARNVFQEAPDKLASSFFKLTNAIDVAGIKPIKFIMPFIQTPYNIIKVGLQATPVGFIKAVKVTGRAREQAIARATLGSITLAGVGMYAADGKISGTGPKDKNKRDALYRTGWQPNSLKIGDKWYSYQNINPINTLLSIIGNAHDEWKYEGKEKPLDEKLQNTVLGVGNSMLDQTFLSGTSDLLNALSDPERYGNSFRDNWIRGFIPGAIKQPIRALQPELPAPKGLKEKVKADIGLIKGMAIKTDVFGKQIKRQPATGLPIFPTTEKIDEVDKMLKELDLTVTFPGKSIKKKDEKEAKTLSEKEYWEYVKISGEKLHSLLERDLNKLKKTSPDKQKDVLDDLQSEAREYAREKLGWAKPKPPPKPGRRKKKK